MNDCLFCKIIAGEIPCKKAYEDESVLAFHDIAPRAPIHILFVPKTHMPDAAAINDDNAALVGHILACMAKVARELGVADCYKVVSNCGEGAGQTVKHLHFHLLAGGDMSNIVI